MDALLATWLALGATAFIGLFYRYATSTFRTFEKMGVPGPKPSPIFGNMWGVWRKNLVDYDVGLVKKYGDFIGIYEGLRPNLFIADVNLIRQIFIKDFDKFSNRRSFNMKGKYTRVFLTILNGQKWKEVRSVISPTFTTGKIKRMSAIIHRCTEALIESLDAVVKGEGKANMKTCFNNLTMDIIARCAFGLNIDNIYTGEDEFTRNAAALFDAKMNKTPIVLLPFAFPWLMRFAEKGFMTKENLFFQKIAIDMVAERKRNPGSTDDFITLALESIKESVDNGGTPWDDSEIEEIVVAQSIIFLLAGFDSTSTTITFASYFLATNPDIQDRLHSELSEKLDQYGDVTHELVNDFPYVDQFVNEVLRIHSPATRTERECVQATQYDDLKIEKGCMVTFPIYAIHHDERHYPDPEKFDPERWTPENKAKRSPYAFLPFGLGPRNCVAMRFALEEVKIAVCMMVRRYRFFRVDETPDRFKQEDGFLFLLQPRNIVVGIEARN